MTEPATRNFMSEWSYNRDLGRVSPRDESTQWIGVERVAELMRQREEHNVDDFNAMDFETRAAALEAHYFKGQARGCDRGCSPLSGRKSPVHAKKVVTRPQSASLARCSGEVSVLTNAGTGISMHPRPQSAKMRSEMPCTTNATQIENHAAWKSSTPQNPTKWREMLAHGPEFKQLALRRLELETYELLYNTLQHQQVVEAKPAARRRRRKGNEKGASKPLGNSPALACGSGLHLARSRKKRQQEHDHQMMLGKGRQTSQQNKIKKGREDKQSIQDKTRRRSKLLSKKRSEKHIQGQPPPANQVLKHEVQHEPTLQHQSIGTTRTPWVPSGSACSLAIRGISSEINEAHLTQEKRIAQVLEAFQSHTKSHLRLSKHVQDQLKKAQRYAKAASANDSRRIEEVIKNSSISTNHLKRPRSGSTVKISSARAINIGAPIYQGNQENDSSIELDAHGIKLTEPTQNVFQLSAVPLLSQTPPTPKLVIPPLKFPPNLWEYQSTNETGDDFFKASYHVQPSITLSYAVTDVHSPLHRIGSPEENVYQDNTEDDDIPEKNVSTEVDFDSKQTIMSTMRRESVKIEDEYLTEDHADQADSKLSREHADSSPVYLPQDSQKERGISVLPAGDPIRVVIEFAETGSYDSIHPGSSTAMDAFVHADEGALRMMNEKQRGAIPLSEVELNGEIVVSLEKEIVAPIEATDPQLSENEASVCTRKEQTTDLNDAEVAKSTNIVRNTVVGNGQQAGELNQRVDVGPSIKSKEFILDRDQERGAIPERLTITASSRVDNYQVMPLDSPQIVCEENETSESVAAILSMPSLECQEVDHDFDPTIGKMESENLLITRNCNLPQQQFACSESDSEDLHDACRGNQAAFPEVQIGVKRDFDILGAGTGIVSDVRSAGTLHGQRSENGSENSLTASLPSNEHQPLQTGGVVAITHSTARLSDTSPTESIAETVSKAASFDDFPTQMPLTPFADVPASPINDCTEQLLLSIDTRLESSGTEMKNQVRMDQEAMNHGTAKATSPKSTKQGTSSPKRKAKKSKALTTCSGEVLKKSKVVKSVHERPSSPSNATKPEIAVKLPAEVSFPKANDSKAGLSEEGPLRHQQELTRSFLKRVSSRKVSESPGREQVERDIQKESTELTTAKTAAAVMDVETQMEDNEKFVKESKYNDVDSASILDNESLQTLSDSDSTTEKYSAPTKEPALTLTSVKDGMAASFTSVIVGLVGLTSASAMTDTRANLEKVDPPSEVGQEGTNNQDKLAAITTRKLTPAVNLDVNIAVDNDSTLSSAEHHGASCKIQAQYRCFARRRLFLDQLRFMLAKERRQVRRKTRHKVKKPKSVVMENEHPATTMVVDSSSVGGAQEVAQQVARNSVSCEIGVEMPLNTLPIEEAEPSVKDAMLGPHKDSCEYIFDLVGGASGNVMQASAESGEDKLTEEVKQPNDQQEGIATLLDKGVEPTALLQAELMVGPELESKDEPAATSPSGLLTPVVLAELAFSDDTEELSKVSAAEVQPHWERYVDSTTSKSFYYNPATNETQWSAPAEQDHAAINSSSTTPHTAAATTTGGQSKPTHESMGTWQEFLDETSGQMFYYNTKTGESSWEPPAALVDGSAEVVGLPQSEATAESSAGSSNVWVMYIDPASQAPYYVNVETLATSWERPVEFKSKALVGEDAYVIAVDDHAALEI